MTQASNQTAAEAGKAVPEEFTPEQPSVVDSIIGQNRKRPRALIPVLSSLRYFRNEYEAHGNEEICPVHACVELVKFEIDVEKRTM